MASIRKSYCNENEIISLRSRGVSDLPVILKTIQNITKEYNSHESLLILIEFKESFGRSTPSDQFDAIVEKIKEHIVDFDFIKLALIAYNPTDIAYAMLFQKRLMDMPKCYHRVFSTEESAKDWLLSW